MNKVQALVRIATRTIGRITKYRVKHMYLHHYQTIHHQYDHPHLMIIQPITTEYKTVFNNAGLLVIHNTLDRTTSSFLMQLHLEVTIGNRSSTSQPVNKPPQQLSWKQSDFKQKDPRTLNHPHSSNYNPLLSYRNWS